MTLAFWPGYANGQATRTHFPIDVICDRIPDSRFPIPDSRKLPIFIFTLILLL
ncbi:MAG: hypothetical protein F6J90_39985 [Moorea sp. SIOASIH]|uniref:hypothetical protein n=1 Tax=Moorena sp. SIOASIH TaxID=2607817 RepID=UPI0013BD610E|nr:hypothetical protein [Moorena sp. SIOASIH]NEO42174.1 hypothetical protein [Moorena sp. SIOASIH]